jgi:hypothetical protein
VLSDVPLYSAFTGTTSQPKLSSNSLVSFGLAPHASEVANDSFKQLCNLEQERQDSSNSASSTTLMTRQQVANTYEDSVFKFLAASCQAEHWSSRRVW